MPRISSFYGVVIYMDWNEKDHPVDDLHAHYAGRRASVSAYGGVHARSLEPRALRQVAAGRAGEGAERARADPSYRR
jgi:hypothetical protein